MSGKTIRNAAIIASLVVVGGTIMYCSSDMGVPKSNTATQSTAAKIDETATQNTQESSTLHADSHSSEDANTQSTEESREKEDTAQSHTNHHATQAQSTEISQDNESGNANDQSTHDTKSNMDTLRQNSDNAMQSGNADSQNKEQSKRGDSANKAHNHAGKTAHNTQDSSRNQSTKTQQSDQSSQAKKVTQDSNTAHNAHEDTSNPQDTTDDHLYEENSKANLSEDSLTDSNTNNHVYTEDSQTNSDKNSKDNMQAQDANRSRYDDATAQDLQRNSSHTSQEHDSQQREESAQNSTAKEHESSNRAHTQDKHNNTQDDANEAHHAHNKSVAQQDSQERLEQQDTQEKLKQQDSQEASEQQEKENKRNETQDLAQNTTNTNNSTRTNQKDREKSQKDSEKREDSNATDTAQSDQSDRATSKQAQKQTNSDQTQTNAQQPRQTGACIVAPSCNDGAITNRLATASLDLHAKVRAREEARVHGQPAGDEFMRLWRDTRSIIVPKLTAHVRNIHDQGVRTQGQKRTCMAEYYTEVLEDFGHGWKDKKGDKSPLYNITYEVSCRDSDTAQIAILKESQAQGNRRNNPPILSRERTQEPVGRTPPACDSRSVHNQLAQVGFNTHAMARAQEEGRIRGQEAQQRFMQLWQRTQGEVTAKLASRVSNIRDQGVQANRRSRTCVANYYTEVLEDFGHGWTDKKGDKSPLYIVYYHVAYANDEDDEIIITITAQNRLRTR